jgi:predicted P-loop ATPase
MSDVAMIKLAVDTLTPVLRGLFNWKKEENAVRQAQKKAALTSLVLAASETRQYLAAVRANPAEKSTTKQEELALLWNNAGIDMMDIDSGIAQTYLLKGDYWSDPQGWTESKKDETAIMLDSVYSIGRQALLHI